MKFLLTLILPMFLMLGCGGSGSSSESANSEYLQVSESTKAGHPSLVPVESYIVLTFTTQINEETVNSSTVYLLDENNTHVPTEVNASGNSISIVPNEYLFEDCQYTIVVTTELQDVQGRSLEENFTYTFKTVNSADTTAPTIDAQTHSYEENQVADAVVATVIASDNVGVVAYKFDATDTQISADDYFKINNTGEITITDIGIITEMNDFETTPNSGDYDVTVTDAAGNSNTATVTLNVTDVDEGVVATYTVSGTASGHRTVELTDGTETISILEADTNFSFATTYTDAESYNITIVSQPTDQDCSLGNGTGIIDGANITDVNLTCTTDPLRIDASSVVHSGSSKITTVPFHLPLIESTVTIDKFNIQQGGIDLDITKISVSADKKKVTITTQDTFSLPAALTISGSVEFEGGYFHNGGVEATYQLQ